MSVILLPFAADRDATHAGSFPKPRLSARFSHHGFILTCGRSRALQLDSLDGNLRCGVILAYGHLPLTPGRPDQEAEQEDWRGRSLDIAYIAQSSAFELGVGVGQFFLVRNSPRHARMLVLLTSRDKLLVAIPPLCLPKKCPLHSQMSSTEAALPCIEGKWEVNGSLFL